MKKILIIGSVNVDYIANVSHLPKEGETIIARGVQICYGGKGANQAAAIARLGGDVVLIGCLGGDEHAPAIVARLREYGVNISGIEMVAGVPTGAAYIYVGDEGESHMVLNPGANNFVSAEVIGRRIRLFEGVAYCIVQLGIPLSTVYHIAGICRERGIRLILDPASATALDFNQLQGTYLIAPSEDELGVFVPGPEDIAAKARNLMELGFENVLVRKGEEGGFLLNEQGLQAYEAYHGLEVMDTTAAGDSFLATLAYALAKDMDILRAINMAAKSAAITASRKGALQSVPSRSEIFE
ncbi:MAG: ribokinase [Defluviitaleaceae bacterium]|nr:ribokinase [Defluviitaleaceae bacterium]